MGATLMAAAVATNLCTTADLAAIPDADYLLHREFTVRGTVIARARDNNFILADSYGRQIVWNAGNMPEPGDMITLRCHTKMETEGLGRIEYVDHTKIGSAAIPPPIDVLPTDLSDKKLEFAVVRMRGFVSEAHVDEIDPAWSYLILRSGSESSYVFLFNRSKQNALDRFIDAEVALIGICIPKHGGLRVFIGPHVELRTENDISIVTPAPADPFTVPDLKDLHHVSANEVLTLGRRRITGHVIATWHGDHFLIRTSNSRIVGVEASNDIPMPRIGQVVDAVGYPETDLYRINLSRARWRPSSDAESDVSTSETIPFIGFIPEMLETPRLLPENHGRLVRLEGTIRSLPSANGFNELLNVSCGNYLVPVDIGSCPAILRNLDIGSRVRIDGICVMDVPNWQVNAAFPRIKGFFVAVRDASDVTVLSSPPWWTPNRLLAVIGTLLAILAAILFWNLSLRRLAERRGRALFKAEIGKAGAELRIDERTRLAVELHDSLAQNLTAISFQLSSAIRSRKLAPEASDAHLKNASDMLHSCRTELRRCLWDLRSDTLEERNFAEAIRKTVSTVIAEAALHIRFNIPRAHVSDTTTHAILCIIRELAANAVRHGHAKNVWIAGELIRRTLRFSVRDDGIGFDSAHHPGEDTGHFGLKGIRERLNPLDGELTYATVAHGTRAIVSINLPHESDESKPED